MIDSITPNKAKRWQVILFVIMFMGGFHLIADILANFVVGI